MSLPVLSEKEYKEQIYKRAADVKTKEDLISVLDEITSYGHDYGTIVYGCMAAMKAAFNYVNRSGAGGITGFQAGCIGWECVKEFLSVNGPARLMQYDNMLYPQYAEDFEKTISEDVWKELKDKAIYNLACESGSPAVVAHWKSIAENKVPFGYLVKKADY